MKAMKKMLSLLVAVMMIVAMCVPAMAAKITITGGASGSEYAAYKLLNATDGGNGKFAYTVNSKYQSILQTATGKTSDADIVAYINDLNTTSTPTIQGFANTVYAAIKSGNVGADYTTSENEFANVDQGYYLIAETKVGSTQDTYSLVMLDTAGNDNISVATKEDTPELVKKVKEKNDSTGKTTGWQDAADYDIGDNVPFQLTGTVSAKYGDYKTYKYVFHDKLSNGLTLNGDSITVKVDDTTIDKSNYSVVTTGLTDDCTFEVQFSDLKKIASVSASSKIVVEYTATLNGSAVIGSTGNPNTASLEYSNNPYDESNPTTGKTPEDKVIVFTYQLVANKVDKEGNALSGAGFTLYKYDSTKKDYAVVGSEVKGVTTFNFKGIDAGQYKLVETTVPDGYNKAADVIFTVEATYDTDSADPKLTALTVKDSSGNVISTGNDATFTPNTTAGTVTTDVVNQSGSELPSTGGIGTTIFYVVGSIMVVGAAVLLITKKRMSDAE